MNDYERMSKAELVQRLRALEQLDNERRLTEAEEQVHLIQSAVEQGFSTVLITNADLPDPCIVYINPAFAKATVYSTEKVVGRPLSSLARGVSPVTLEPEVLMSALRELAASTQSMFGVIYFQSFGNRITLGVRDNGVGFPKSIAREKGMGLRVMQSRARMIGGSRSIEKEPASGAIVVCSVPAGA